MDLYTIRKELMFGKTIYDLPLRVVYYGRVSTKKDEQKNSLENQDSHYKDIILNNPNWTFVGGYTDRGITGTSTKKRNDFNNMIEDGFKNCYDLILTKEVCRFARNTLDTLQITRELLAKGIGVFFELDNINTLEQEGELRLTIMASLAQDESRKISDRTKFGFARSIEKGRVLGNNAIWGYQKNKCKLEINEEEAHIIKRIYEIYSTGKIGIKKIGEALAKEGILTRKGEVFAYSTIKYILTNPKYKGFYSGNKSKIIDFMTKQRVYLDKEEFVEYKANEDVVPQIIDEKMWERCNAIFNERSERAKSETNGYNNKYKYSGKIFCKKDGKTYWRTLSRGKEYWQCAIYKAKGTEGCNNNVNIYTESLDNLLINVFDELFANKDKYIEELLEKCINIIKENSSEADMQYINNKIEDLKREKKKLIKLYTSDLITEKEFEEENSIYNRKIEEFELEYNNLLEESSEEKILNKCQLLKKSFEKDLLFKTGFPDELVNAMLEKIKVEKIHDDGTAKLEVFLKSGISFNILYKKKKIFNYINNEKIA